MAYVVGEQVGDTAVLAGIRTYLKAELPQYALPTYIIPLDQLPLAASGKIDRQKLPDPEAAVTRIYSGVIKEEAANKTEKEVASIWQTTLKVDSIDVNTNFFELGGHSLLAAQLTAQIRQQMNCQLAVADLFEFPTIRLLAAQVDRTKNQEAPPVAP